MTNKVKPFYIKITDDMTPQMVQDAFDKCVDAGAKSSNNDETENFRDWGYFGVCGRDGTYLSDSHHGYFDAQEITLGQLDKWLGLELEQEWKAGDRVTIRNPEGFGTWDEADKYLGANGTVMAVFTNTNGKKVAAVSHDDNVCICWMLSMLSKPETPEQKAERERIENGKAIYDLMSSIEMNHDIAGIPNTWAELRDEWQSVYIQLAESVGYRKQ